MSFRAIIIGFSFLWSFSKLTAQVSYNLEEEFDILTYQWLDISGELKTYEGMANYCLRPEYEAYAKEVLEYLHHYDSVVLDIIKYPTPELEVSNREYKRTIRDIEKFETRYTVRDFIDFLHESCSARRDLEMNKQALKNEIGLNSYDAQVQVLESHLRKYLKHIDKKIIAIDDHILMLHPEQAKPLGAMAGLED